MPVFDHSKHVINIGFTQQVVDEHLSLDVVVMLLHVGLDVGTVDRATPQPVDIGFPGGRRQASEQYMSRTRTSMPLPASSAVSLAGSVSP